VVLLARMMSAFAVPVSAVHGYGVTGHGVAGW
jgi:hypothetical protein